MTDISEGTAIPDFELPATDGDTVSLSGLRGRNVVLYFYPKADTPGCTREGQDFRDLNGAFDAANTVILGISRDGVKAQQRFKDKYEFPFPLLADTEEAVCNLFGVIREKNMYGRRVMGVERSTFLIDADGVLRREWRGVRVKGHADQVLEAVKALG